MELNSSTLLEIAQQFNTPLYVYNVQKITEQYKKLVDAFKTEKVKFFYASKALTNIHILNHIKSIGCNIDCSSINEVKLALHVGFTPNQILYTSNGIHFSEIEEAKNFGVHINIDSLSNLEKFGKAFGGNYPVGLRLRPNIMAGGNIKISTGHDKSKFGIPVDQLSEIVAVVNKFQINITNLHIHTGSEVKDVEVWINGLEVLFDIVSYFPNLKSIDLGGGFKVPYKSNEKGTDIELLAIKVLEAFEKNTLTKHLEIWFEPGKFLVSEAGYFLTKVNVLKNTKTACFAGVDTGFNHLIRPMFYDAYHFIHNISHPNKSLKKYAVVGNICETDTFAWDREIAEIEEGDILCFNNAGAYGFEMSSNFNSRYKPAEVLVDGDVVKLIRRRDVFEDLLTQQTPL
jgi:diaminopimelate decarboxylase